MRKVVDYGQFMQTQREERSLAEAIQKSEEKNKIAETIDNTTVDFLSGGRFNLSPWILIHK
jgi:hypothetical protein